MRMYRQLKIFTSAQALTEDHTNLKNGELAVFIRFGSDYRSNFYEYEIPLSLTNPGHYNNDLEADRLAVWPIDNTLNIALSVFTDLKKKRNVAKNHPNSGVSYGKVYSEYDSDQPANKVSIMGNLTLSVVKSLLIGVRYNSRAHKSAEV